MLELLKYDFFQNALISTLLIGISCGLVGTYIVAKRMVFISGGITHASFGGLGLSYYLGLSPMLGATAFSILSALGILFLSDSKKLKEDSLIGIFWSAGMAIGILFIYLTPGYAPNLMSYLFGNILTVTREQIILSVVLCLGIILFFARFLIISSADRYPVSNIITANNRTASMYTCTTHVAFKHFGILDRIPQ